MVADASKGNKQQQEEGGREVESGGEEDVT